MRKINEVLRLNGEKGFSARQIAKSCEIARSIGIVHPNDYIHELTYRFVIYPGYPLHSTRHLPGYQAFLAIFSLETRNGKQAMRGRGTRIQLTSEAKK